MHDSILDSYCYDPKTMEAVIHKDVMVFYYLLRCESIT